MSELPTEFHIPKNSMTHSDVFLALGLADLLQGAADGPPHLREQPGEFIVSVGNALTETHLARIKRHPGFQYLKANAKSAVPPVVGPDYVDYPQKAALVKQIRKLNEASRNQRAVAQDAELDELSKQVPDNWRQLQVLNTLQGDENTNKVYLEIATLKDADFQKLLGNALARFAQRSPSELAWKVTSVQLFSPIAAKGYARLKPDSTDRNDKTKDQWVDPFQEWLRYRGYFIAACPYFQGKRGEHIRMIVPVPKDISIRAYIDAVEQFRKARVRGEAPKLDALAVLGLAKVLIERSEEYAQYGQQQLPQVGRLRFGSRRPADLISGVMITHYQSLGQSKAVLSISTLALPGWFPIRSPEDAKLWWDILDEHQRVIRGLQDDHSDEIGLLVDYRRFLEARGDSSRWALVEFIEKYGPFILRAREQGRRVRAFREDYFRRIIMDEGNRGDKFTEILSDSGFRAVAAAVRRATVSAQGQKAMGQRDHREIRYDLLHDLRRTRSMPGDEAFMEKLSEFIASYNYENARRREMGKHAPANVTTEEFASFATLVDKHGASLVGALLAAYGSCREPRTPEEEEVAGADEEAQGDISDA